MGAGSVGVVVFGELVNDIADGVGVVSAAGEAAEEAALADIGCEASESGHLFAGVFEGAGGIVEFVGFGLLGDLGDGLVGHAGGAEFVLDEAWSGTLTVAEFFDVAGGEGEVVEEAGVVESVEGFAAGWGLELCFGEFEVELFAGVGSAGEVSAGFLDGTVGLLAGLGTGGHGLGPFAANGDAQLDDGAWREGGDAAGSDHDADAVLVAGVGSEGSDGGVGHVVILPGRSGDLYGEAGDSV